MSKPWPDIHYPLVGEVVRAGATYRDFIRHHDRVDSVRIRVVRPCGPQYPPHYWVTEVCQSGDRRWLGMTIIASEAHIYAARMLRGIQWAGHPIEGGKGRPVPWIPKPDDGQAPYGGLQQP